MIAHPLPWMFHSVPILSDLIRAKCACVSFLLLSFLKARRCDRCAVSFKLALSFSRGGPESTRWSVGQLIGEEGSWCRCTRETASDSRFRLSSAKATPGCHSCVCTFGKRFSPQKQTALLKVYLEPVRLYCRYCHAILTSLQVSWRDVAFD